MGTGGVSSPWWARISLIVALVSLWFSFANAIPLRDDTNTLTTRDQDFYGTAVRIGKNMEAAMELDASQTAKLRLYLDKIKEGIPVSSPYTKWSQLAEWGWDEDNMGNTPAYKDSLQGVFKSLGVNPDNNLYISQVQRNDVTVDGIEYEVSICAGLMFYGQPQSIHTHKGNGKD